MSKVLGDWEHHWFKIHIAPWLTWTQQIGLTEEGALMRLLVRLHANGGVLPDDRNEIYRLAGTKRTQQRAAVDSVLNRFFKQGPSGWAFDVPAMASMGRAKRNQRKADSGSVDTDHVPSAALACHHESDLADEINVPDAEEEGIERKEETERKNTATSVASPSSNLIGDTINEQVPWLIAGSGRTERDCRAMLGMWRKNHTDAELLSCLHAAQRQRASDPIAYLTKALKPKATFDFN